MTAEVVLMNKQAVAMATDSAGTSGWKISNSNNKLFTLSKWQPIGIMIYGSAGIMGYPWETIIKTYRKSLNETSFNTLHGYVEDFLKYLQELKLFDEQAEQVYIKKTFEDVLSYIWDQIRYTEKQSLKDIISEIKRNSEKEIIFEIKKDSKNKFVKCIAHNSDKQKIINKYKKIATDSISKFVKKLSKYLVDDSELYKDISADIMSIMKNMIFCNPEHIGYSGLVFSGFGESDFFPVTENFIISSIMRSKIMKSDAKIHSIKLDGTSLDDFAFIKPFAQTNTVDSFVYGIDTELRDMIKTEMPRIFKILSNKASTEVSAKISTKISDFSQEDKLLLKKFLNETLDEIHKPLLEEMLSYMDNILYERYEKPIKEGISNLPPGELASMAETLVSLTSFRNKISANQRETVGGPTDVAVITKGDGFVWIKRKLYFDRDKNHHFFENYFKDKKEEKS